MPTFVRRNDYLTTAQASKFLNVSRFTVLNWIKSGKLQSASTFGGHSRIPKGVLQAAVRQIKTTDRLKPPALGLDSIVNCWESKEIGKCGTHNCNKCLVFKKKLNRCFLAVGSYGALKRECAHDCVDCAYLAKHYPQERRAMLRLQTKAFNNQPFNSLAKTGVRGIIKKVFYNSGRLIGSLKKKKK